MRTAGRRLEDLFFYRQDAQIQEKQRLLRQMAVDSNALRESSGITDERVVHQLMALQVRPETIASLVVVPLIEVAWANGRIEAREKAAILRAIKAFGWPHDSIDYRLVERWLEHKPGPALFSAWAAYVNALCRQMPAAESARFSAEIIAHARAVGAASGGLFGIGKTSVREQEVLRRVRESLKGHCGECV